MKCLELDIEDSTPERIGFRYVAVSMLFMALLWLIIGGGCNNERRTASRTDSDDEYKKKDELPPLVKPADILKQGQSPFWANQDDDDENNSSNEQDEKSGDNVTDFDYNRSGGNLNDTFNVDSISATTPEAKNRSQQITMKAVALLKEGNIDQSIIEFNDAITVDPFNHEALFQLMVILDERGQSRVQMGKTEEGYNDLIASGKAAQRLVDTRSAIILDSKNVVLIGNAFYNAACGYCREGAKQKAIKSLEQALRYRFDKPELLKTDPDLQPIRGMPAFQSLLKK